MKSTFKKSFNFQTLALIPVMSLGYIFSSHAQNTKPPMVIDDFQKINSMTINKSAWKTFTDIDNGGGSIIKFSYQKENKSKEINLNVQYKLEQGNWQWAPYAAITCNLTSKEIPTGVQAVAYEFKGSSHNFVYRCDNIKDYAFYERNIPESKEWSTVTIPISELTQPSWGARKPLSEADLNSLAWQVIGLSGDSGSFSIDNVRFLYTPQLTLSSKNNFKNDVNSIRETIHSSILNEDRELWISLPTSVEEMKKSNKKYPVIYVLDGDSHIKTFSSMTDQLGIYYGNSVFPEMIIVGILNTDRWRDLSPTHITKTPFNIDSTLLTNTGGGENFIKFIEKELISHIDSIYPTAPNRTFVGHSLGGLTVLNTLIHHPHIFNYYLAIDPSLWWDNQLLNKQAKNILHNVDVQNKRLFIAIANTLPDEYDITNIRKDTAINATHMRSIFEFTDILKMQPKSGLQWDYKYYENDTHNSVPFIADYDGMRYFFNYHKIKFDDKMENADFNIESAITTHYKIISKEFGCDVSFEEVLNNYGRRFIRNKNYKQALVCFKTNTNNYPNSVRAWENLGNIYEKIGDIPNAVMSYSKCLLIAEIPSIRKKMNKLQEVSTNKD
ncbi:MAG: hypothetical protein J7604_23200 [Sporocytophaga sp.]|uniref:alpha/beta hydrolase-fold protein n=1 Tax=Sporocytophaga sp. TaxID=2231183 RepID=UPI001B1FBCEC|nr:alpha/beta hydrolase-fold protein [Sporocytophaga sp.]MBO9703140.1 hypothetical protein [Sporocytophaga sp.]